MPEGDQAARLREGFESHARTLYTATPAILIDVDDNHRGTVRHYHYLRQRADDVPIRALYTGDGYGEQHALHLPEVGHMISPMYPDEDARDPDRRGEPPTWSRHHGFIDGTFVADVRQDDEAPLDSPLGEYLYKHMSGAIRKVTEDGRVVFESADGDTVAVNNGSILAQQTDGQYLRLNASESTLAHSSGHEVSVTAGGIAGTHNANHEFAVQDGGLWLRYERGDGQLVEVDVSETDISLSIPDENNDFASNPRSEISVSEDGRATLDGRASIGDSDAYRVDTTTENTDASDPRTYAEVDEPVAPIQDTTNDSETQYDNPSTASADGPVEMGFYELRQHIPERRAADPDVTVTDPTNDAYVDVPQSFRDAGSLPVGYQYINTNTGELKIVGMDGTPMVVTTL